MQASIYRSLGFEVLEIVQNGVDECSADHAAIGVGGDKVNLLFVGRLVGKGLHYALDLTASNSGLHLFLVGGSELLDEARKSLDDSRFTYFGKLDSLELKDVYHNTDYVLVMSECFDVFPGVLMEALSHGCKVLTSRSVGNSHLGIKESLTTIIDSRDDFQKINFQKCTKSNVLLLPGHLEVQKRYLRIFEN
jgi:glycosyltransferase involved in cell wall biosynthesis